MKRAIAAAAVTLVLAATAGAEPRQRRARPARPAREAAVAAPAAEERREFPVSGGGTLDLSNIAGDVRITARRGDTIEVRAVRRPAGGRTSAEDLRQLRVEMQQTGDRVEVRGRGPRSGRSRGAIDFTVTVPPEARVVARSVSGDVAVTGVRGEVRLETVSGSVTASDAANVTLAKTVSGDVSIRSGGSDRTLVLGTVSGTVLAAGVRAPALDASTVSGDIRLTDIAAERASAKSVSGTVEYTGPLGAGGRFEFTSHSGDVTVRLPARSSFDLMAESFSGPLTTDFPVTLRSTRGSRTSRAVRGVAGDGGAQLVVRSFSGAVTIARR